ncbi:MAG: hypothetical protein HY649_06210 [Acidobacteria bacterium]|nr:hypothetical protein [Acidobacteriota bacterium]
MNSKTMYSKTMMAVVVWSIASFSIALAQTTPLKTTWVSLGSSSDGVLFEPLTPGPHAHLGIIYTYPSSSNIDHSSGRELSRRGYRVLLLNHHGDPIGYEAMAPSISKAVQYMRGLPGIEKVVLLSTSAGGPLVAFYQNIAENGPRACQGPEKIFPCPGDGLTGLEKADGLVVLDSHLGEGFRVLTYVDPAVSNEMKPSQRDPQLDMFDVQNGYDRKSNGGKYGEVFTRKFFAAQAARNEKLIAAALSRWKAIQAGSGDYKDDEPFIVPESGGARLLQADVRLVSRTRKPHPLLKTDGSIATKTVRSVRPPMARFAGLGTYEQFAEHTSVRRFLATAALRTTSEYNMTEDSITGVDWASSNTSAPSNIKGVTVPFLIMAMSCHYFLVPDEIIFDNAASKDKRYVLVEGASHGYTPCKPEYGDTLKKVYDYIDSWLAERGRFSPR